MVLHAVDASQSGHMNITIRTVDTDVVVVLIAFFHHIECEELWILFCVGKCYRNMTIHKKP